MKKSIIAVTAVLILTVSELALAQMDKGKDMMGDKGMGMMKGEMMDKGMMDKGMMGDGMMDGGMMKMMKMMHAHGMMMRSPTMVASNDGGVIVLSGNKLYKYDKSLNLVKEAEIKMDMSGGMMGGMGGMKTMMGQGDTDDEAAEGEADQPAQEDAEHKSHH